MSLSGRAQVKSPGTVHSAPSMAAGLPAFLLRALRDRRNERLP